ncbi:MAG: hypothetical protein ACYS8Z_08450 [Planctomycetota bacterium]|jgi:hypothetical protein
MEYFDPIPSYGEKGERAEDINSGEMIVVYEARPDLAMQAASMLKEAGLNPILQEKGCPKALFVGHGADEAPELVSVTVPREQFQRAESLLQEWHETTGENVECLGRSIKVQALGSLSITLAIGGLLRLLGILNWGNCLLLVFVWVAAFALLANAGKISRYSKKD